MNDFPLTYIIPIFLACEANKWVGRLSYLLICVTRTWRKSLNLCRIPSITLAIIAGASVDPFKASKTVFESHSNTTSRTPTSHAKAIPLPCSTKVLLGCVISYLKSLLPGLHSLELPPNPSWLINTESGTINI